MTDVEQAIGAAVRTMRTSNAVSQEALATEMTRAGFPMTQPVIYKLEQGQRPLRVNEVFALADIFGVAAEDLIRAAARSSTPGVTAGKRLFTDRARNRARHAIAQARKELDRALEQL